MIKNKVFDIKERTYQYALGVLNFSKALDKNLNNQILIKQLIRSATSVGANIAEGKYGCSRKDFINFYMIALKSANESIYWLNLIKDTNKSVNIDKLLLETEEIAKILARVIINLKK